MCQTFVSNINNNQKVYRPKSSSASVSFYVKSDWLIRWMCVRACVRTHLYVLTFFYLLFFVHSFVMGKHNSSDECLENISQNATMFWFWVWRIYLTTYISLALFSRREPERKKVREIMVKEPHYFLFMQTYFLISAWRSLFIFMFTSNAFISHSPIFNVLHS